MRFTPRIMRTLAGGMCLLATMTALAAEAAPAAGGIPMFAQFDRDGDGFVTEEEFNATRAEHRAARAEGGMPMKGMASAPGFADFDDNGDGKLTPDEFASGHRHGMQSGHAGYGHGKGMHRPEFADIDTDGDGCISAEEFAAHQASWHAQQQQ